MFLTYSACSFRFACNPENPKILYILMNWSEIDQLYIAPDRGYS